MHHIDINKELPYFQERRLTQEEIDTARKSGMVLLHDSRKGKIWYKLPIKEIHFGPNQEIINVEFEKWSDDGSDDDKGGNDEDEMPFGWKGK
jgi:hypothetical protein